MKSIFELNRFFLVTFIMCVRLVGIEVKKFRPRNERQSKISNHYSNKDYWLPENSWHFKFLKEKPEEYGSNFERMMKVILLHHQYC